jgi:hypothetical protein
MTYYDSDRDYQIGQMRASGGRGGARDERIELPAVLTAGQAKGLVEQALARRWRAGDRIRISLPPSRMDLSPGDAIQLEESAMTWVVQSVSIEEMAVIVEAEAAPVTVPALPADPGRPISEPDLTMGRTDLMLFEMPATLDEPGDLIQVHLAASNEGLWKSVPVELMLGSQPLASVAVTRRAIFGRAETLLDPRVPMICDELSTVDVKLANSGHVLLNVDEDALMAGANLASLGDELIQFGRAEPLGSGRFRLSKLLRGRRGTEWAAATHAVGEAFCLIDHAAIRRVELPTSGAGAMLAATAHGINDVAPLPTCQRLVSGESLRPPSPCHLKVLQEGIAVRIQWTRRSHRGWSWTDGVGDADDPFGELYRLTIIGPAGQIMIECTSTTASVPISELPATPGQSVSLSVVTVGPMALSRAATTTFIV